MLFSDSLRTSEVPNHEQCGSTIIMVDSLISRYLIRIGASFLNEQGN